MVVVLVIVLPGSKSWWWDIVFYVFDSFFRLNPFSKQLMYYYIYRKIYAMCEVWTINFKNKKKNVFHTNDKIRINEHAFDGDNNNKKHSEISFLEITQNFRSVTIVLCANLTANEWNTFCFFFCFCSNVIEECQNLEIYAKCHFTLA